MTAHRLSFLLIAAVASGCHCFQVSERYGDCIDKIADKQIYFDRFYREKLDLTRICWGCKIQGKNYCPPVAVYPDVYIPTSFPASPTPAMDSDLVPSLPVEDLPQEFEREIDNQLKSTFPEAIPTPPEPQQLPTPVSPDSATPIPSSPPPMPESFSSVNPASMEIEQKTQSDLTIEAAQILDLEKFEYVENTAATVESPQQPAAMPRPFVPAAATTPVNDTPQTRQSVTIPPAQTTPATIPTVINGDVKQTEVSRKPISAPKSVTPSPKFQYEWQTSK